MVREDKVGRAIKYCVEKLFDDSCQGQSWALGRRFGAFRSYRKDIGVYVGLRSLRGGNINFYIKGANFVLSILGGESVIDLCDYFDDPMYPQEQEIVLFSTIHPCISSVLESVGGCI